MSVICQIHEVERDAVVRKDRREQAVAPAVQVVGGDDLIPGLQGLEDGVHGRQARGKSEPMAAVLEGRKGGFECRACGIVCARVLKPFVVAHTILDVGGRQVNRSHDGSCGGVGFNAGVHCEGAAAVVGGHVTHGRRKLRHDGPCWAVVCASQMGIKTPPTKT